MFTKAVSNTAGPSFGVTVTLIVIGVEERDVHTNVGEMVVPLVNVATVPGGPSSDHKMAGLGSLPAVIEAPLMAILLKSS